MAKSSLAEMELGTRFQRVIPEVLHPNPLSSLVTESPLPAENWQKNNNEEPRIPYHLVQNESYPLALSSGTKSNSKNSMMSGEDFTLLPPSETTTLIFCTGQIYYLLSRCRALNNLRHIAIVRIEQLAPFPWWDIRRVVDSYKDSLREIVWCQEEPLNAGAWSFVEPRLETVVRDSSWMKSGVCVSSIQLIPRAGDIARNILKCRDMEEDSRTLGVTTANLYLSVEAERFVFPAEIREQHRQQESKNNTSLKKQACLAKHYTEVN